MRTLLISMVMLLALALAGLGQAAIVYSSFTEPGDYIAEWQITNLDPGSDAAGMFSVTGADYYLDSIAMYLKDANDIAPDFISLAIAENDPLNNLPGSTLVLAETDFSVDIPNSYTKVVFDPAASPVLRSAMEYWLVASVADVDTTPLLYNWASNRDLPPADLAFRSYSSSWTAFPYYPLAFQINGTPVPLPAAGWLFGLGLLSLVGIRKKVKG